MRCHAITCENNEVLEILKLLKAIICQNALELQFIICTYVQFAAHKGYIQINWGKVNREMEKAKKDLSNELKQVEVAIPGLIEEVLFLPNFCLLF